MRITFPAAYDARVNSRVAVGCAVSGMILVLWLATSVSTLALQHTKRSLGESQFSVSAGLTPKGRIMDSNDESECRGALQPGLLVKDRLGTRKRITHVQDDIVHWEYVNQPPAGESAQNSTPYEDFADSHFVLPQPGPSSGAA